MSLPYHIHTHGKIAELVIEHPPVNALDSAGWQALVDEREPEYFPAAADASDEDVLAQLQLLANSLNFQNQQDAALFGTTYVNTSNGKVLTVTGTASHADSNTIHYEISGGDIQNYAAGVTDTAEVIAEALQAIVDAASDGLIGTVIQAQ